MSLNTVKLKALCLEKKVSSEKKHIQKHRIIYFSQLKRLQAEHSDVSSEGPPSGSYKKLLKEGSLLCRGFKDFLVSSNANALAMISISLATLVMQYAGETKRNTAKIKAREASARFLTKGTISVPSVKTGQGDRRAYYFTTRYINRRYGHIVLNCQTKCIVSFVVFCIVFFKYSLYHPLVRRHTE